MKIAYVVHDYHRSGGHSRYVAELASRFAREHEVHVFANRFEAEAGIRFHKVPAWRASALTTVLTFSLPAYAKVRGDYDIVHVQGFCGPKGNVITTHICNAAWYRALAQWDEVSWRDRLFSWFASNLEHKLYRDAREARVIAISNKVAREVQQLYECSAPTHLIYHGVDVDRFSPAARQQGRDRFRKKLGLLEGEPVFLFVGNLRKGASQCIRALSRLNEGKLILVSHSETDRCRALAEELGCSGRIRFLGPTNAVEEVFGAADAFLLPTPYDTFALVCTEAMACALPVVVSREAGAAELIRHGENGLVLDDVTNAEQLAEYMNSLMRDPKWAQDLGSSARRTVQTMTWDSVAQQTMRVYEELVHGRN